MICPHCHGEHPDRAAFCPVTGKKIIIPPPPVAASKTCPHCSSILLEAVTFCPACGKQLTFAGPSLKIEEQKVLGKERRKPLLGVLVVPFLIVLLFAGYYLISGSGIVGRIFRSSPVLTSGDNFPIPVSTIEQAILPSSSPVPTETASPTATLAPPATPTSTPVIPSSWEQGRLAYIVFDTSSIYSLWSIDLASNGVQKLLINPGTTASHYLAPVFVPGNRSLAFSNLYNSRTYLLPLDPAGKPVEIGSCLSPSFSPDGSRCICDGAGEDAFMIITIDGGKFSTLKTGMAVASLPAWSPDGSEIAFSVNRSGQTSIWKIGVDGSNLTPLAQDGSENYAPAWSPDGQSIAYQSMQTSDRSEIWVMDRSGHNKRQITNAPGFWSRGPSWSPDGQWLAFVSTRAGGVYGDFGEVFLISMVTNEIQQITHTSGHVLDWRVTWGK